MYSLYEDVAQADEVEIQDLLTLILERHAEVFPDWEVTVITLDKRTDRNEQIDRMIAMLENRKKLSKWSEFTDDHKT